MKGPLLNSSSVGPPFSLGCFSLAQRSRANLATELTSFERIGWMKSVVSSLKGKGNLLRVWVRVRV